MQESSRIKGLFIFAIIIFTAVSLQGSNMFRLPEKINDDGDDFSPTATKSGRIIIFNSKKTGEKSHNLYMFKNNFGFWTSPLPLKELNSAYNDETPFISRDGRVLLFSSDRPGSTQTVKTSTGNLLITYDIFISYNVKGTWTKPVPLKGDVNSTWNERSPSLSHDGKTLFFTRWPYKNFSQAKLYMAELKNGRFTNVREVGPPVHDNSFEIAMIPSIEKNKYYFSSIREGGFGGWDIYYTYYLKGKFTKPVNAGKKINSQHDDMYYITTKMYTLLSSNRPEGYGGFDIYSNRIFTDSEKYVRKSFRSSNRETRLKISSINANTGKLMKDQLFTISLISSNGKSRTIKRTSNINGYMVIRPKADVKWMEIRPVSENFGLLKSIKVKVISKKYQDIVLRFTTGLKEEPDKQVKKTEPVKKKTEASIPEKKKTISTVEDSEVYFSFNSSQLKAKYYPSIYKLTEKLRKDKSLKLVITGHADYIGSRKSNYRLSMKRAKSVSSFITGLGIERSRLIIRAKGEDFPITGSNRSRSRSLNRRVVLQLMEEK